MDYAGRDVQGDAADFAGMLSPKWVVRHRGSTADYIKRYRMLAADAAKQKLTGLKELAPSLLGFISDERTLFAAWQHTAAHGGTAPGPDGCRYDEFTVNEVWKWCRATREEIRAGEYTPGEESVHRIPKSSGGGFRELVLQSIFDRVGQRAVVETLQPLLDPLFDRRSFGYRPKKGPLRALATAERLYKSGKKGVWVSVDIRNAFPSVPIGRLLGVVGKYLPDESLLALIKAMTRPDKRPGLRQGGPLSPLLLNLYLHHTLDRKWRALNPKIPLLRFADDILLLCRTEQQARDAYAALTKLLREAGFELKEGEKDAIRLVSVGQEVKWMGFQIQPFQHGLGSGSAENKGNFRCHLSATAAFGFGPQTPSAITTEFAVGYVANVHVERAGT